MLKSSNEDSKIPSRVLLKLLQPFLKLCLQNEDKAIFLRAQDSILEMTQMGFDNLSVKKLVLEMINLANDSAESNRNLYRFKKLSEKLSLSFGGMAEIENVVNQKSVQNYFSDSTRLQKKRKTKISKKYYQKPKRKSWIVKNIGEVI